VNPPQEQTPSSAFESFEVGEGESVSRRRVVRGGTLASLGSLTSQAISLIGFIVLARLAPPSTFGAYAAASILTGASLLFAESGMQSAVIQRPDRVQEAASTAFAANVVGALGLAGIAATLAPLIGLFFHSGEIARVAAALAGTIPLNAASIVPGALLARRVSYRFALIGPFESLAYATAAITALAGGLGLWGLVLATYAAAGARTTIVWVISGWRPSFGLVSWEMWRSLSRYGRPVVLSSFFDEVGRAGGTAVVGRMLNTSALGQFRSAQRLVLQPNTAIVYGSAYVLLPAFSRIWQNEKRFHDSILRALRTLMLMIFPVSLVFIPLGRPFATVLLGQPWRGAGPIMMAMAGVGIAAALGSISAETFKATGRTGLLPRLHALSALLPVALMFALRDLGAPGMGLAVSLGTGMVAVYAIHTLSRITSIPLGVILGEIRPAATSGIVMVGGTFVLDRLLVHAGQSHAVAGALLLVLDLVGAVSLYLGSLCLLSRGSVLELKELTKLLVGRADRSPSSAAG
jgi:O-antigen/teichoic acid export membrane protein